MRQKPPNTTGSYSPLRRARSHPPRARNYDGAARSRSTRPDWPAPGVRLRPGRLHRAVDRLRGETRERRCFGATVRTSHGPGCVVNAASFVGGGVAPGEIVSIFPVRDSTPEL